MVDYLLSLRKALASVPSTTRDTDRERTGEAERERADES